MFNRDYPVGTIKTTKVAFILGTIHSSVKNVMSICIEKANETKNDEIRKILDEITEHLSSVEVKCDHEIIEFLEDWADKTE
jgi:rRNA maturation endonuclease Nob1